MGDRGDDVVDDEAPWQPVQSSRVEIRGQRVGELVVAVTEPGLEHDKRHGRVLREHRAERTPDPVQMRPERRTALHDEGRVAARIGAAGNEPPAPRREILGGEDAVEHEPGVRHKHDLSIDARRDQTAPRRLVSDREIRPART